MSDDFQDDSLSFSHQLAVDKIKPIELTGSLSEDMTRVNQARADLFAIAQEQLKGKKVSAMMLQAAAGLLKDIDDSYIRREKIEVDKSMGDAALLVAEAAAAMMRNGNPHLAKAPIDITPTDIDNSHVDAALPDIDPVHNNTFIGQEELSYDEFSPEGEDDDDDD